ncbi:FAD-dependent monooxygenase [Priestia endophytica]|jgi:2-polyprenyl-6-methoxyphenol hydroxylase-like FAD-dependent oxidoreductase|uniref:FAD-dependent monooxygenase n=1 Tax=Priestia endophytica TaxID=135735 RepID=UPI002E24521A|nr:FAD-dependent monooxygenase [Priestia endophytica]MED4073223.1 FAD-dependent monooxygenase [Priestia endophytica]
MEKEVDVLIVGSGPTGLLAAHALTKQNINIMIVEKKQTPSPLSKALAIHARTMETFDLLGIVDPFLEKGFKATRAHIHLGNKEPFTVPFSSLKSSFPYIFVLPQAETEEILARELPYKVERKTELISIKQHYNYVSCLLQGSETTSVKARYVLACDGAHSSVRRFLGVPFHGEKEGITFFLGDITVEGLKEEKRANLYVNERGIAFIVPISRNVTRVIVADFLKQNESHTRELSLDELKESVNRIIPISLSLHNPVWLSRFGTSHKQVPSYQQDHVFFVGDAAHVHNPAGGQGMNIGLQDAMNISWKLSFVLRGFSPPSLLRSYDEERRPIGKSVLQATSFLIKSVTSQNELFSSLRNTLAPKLIEKDFIATRVLERLSNIGFHYKKSQLSKKMQSRHLQTTGLKSGERIKDFTFYNHEGECRLYELLRTQTFISLFYLDSLQESDKVLIDHFHKALNVHYPKAVNPFVVLGKAPKLCSLPHLVDHHQTLRKNIHMSHKGVLLLRPDGYVAFHQKELNIQEVIHKLSYWLLSKKG